MKPKTAIIFLAIILVFSGLFMFYLYATLKPAKIIKKDHPANISESPSQPAGGYMTKEEKMKSIIEFLENKEKEEKPPRPSEEEIEQKREAILSGIEEKKAQNSNYEADLEKKRVEILEILSR